MFFFNIHTTSKIGISAGSLAPKCQFFKLFKYNISSRRKEMILRKLLESVIAFCLLGTLCVNAIEPVTIEAHLPIMRDQETKVSCQLLFRIIQTRILSACEGKEVIFFTEEGDLIISDGEENFPTILEAFSIEIQGLLTNGISSKEFEEHQQVFWEELSLAGFEEQRSILEQLSFDKFNCICLPILSFLNSFFLVDLSENDELGFESKIALSSVDADPNYQLFYQLRLLDKDKKRIDKLIKELADSSYWSLLRRKKEFDKLKEKIEPIHPLRFIGYIYSKDSLKKRMPRIQNESLKWNRFVSSFGDRMSKEASHGNLLPYLPGFCQLLGVNPRDVEHFIQKRDWKKLLDFLM
jgi:hypothetical protein